MPLTSSVMWQMMAGFRNFYIVKKSQDLVQKGAVRLEQVQRFKQKNLGGGLWAL